VSPSLPAANVADTTLSWRPLTPADDQALHALMRASEVADRVPYMSTLDEVRQRMADPEIELPIDSLGGFLRDGRLACFGAVKLRRHVVRRRAAVQAGTVHPELRRRGLGTLVLRWTEARGRERLADFDDDLPQALECWSDADAADRRALFSSMGYQPARYYDEMVRSLVQAVPAPRLAPGLRFVGWSAALDEAVRQAHNEAFADHWGSEPLTAQSWHNQFVGSPVFRADLSCVVLDGTQVAGYCLAYHAPADYEVSGKRDGWLGQIGVRRPWRKKGVATAIICRVMGAMAAIGLDRAILEVDSDNPSGAAGLYRRLGFTTERREIRWAKAL
jgi:mycothiol synthase